MKDKISVAMATYNGAKFIKEQLSSILNQLGEEDEVVISDNYSTDNTLEIIESFNDKRIRVFKNERLSENGSINCYFNFENALNQTKGDIIFLSDQDDLWKDNKVKLCVSALKQYDMVVTDCHVISKKGDILLDSYFKRRKSGMGFVKNLFANTYLGCCMAFKRNILDIALPFPKQMTMHDILLGTISELFFNPCFIDDKLVLYREHGSNVSPTALGISRFSFGEKIVFRFKVIKYLPLLFYRKYFG
jgi:glycosyltransferase involved in cell wall biosynthesis